MKLKKLLGIRARLALLALILVAPLMLERARRGILSVVAEHRFGARDRDRQRPGDLIEAADAALYAAKHRGRNAVAAHGFGTTTDSGGQMAIAS